MGRYQIKTRTRVFEADSTAQLARFAVMGLIPREAQVKDFDQGRWHRAEAHPEIGRLYSGEDNERTVLMAMPPAPPGDDSSAAGNEESDVFWIKTDASTAEVRGAETLRRLQSLGVLQAQHLVSRDKAGPFLAAAEHPDVADIFNVAVAPTHLGRLNTTPAGRNACAVSVVIQLDEREIEYFQGSDRKDEVSQVVLLTAADLESADDLTPPPPPAAPLDPSLPINTHDLEALDLEPPEAELPPAPLSATWEEFRATMNRVSRCMAAQGPGQESTWELFRSMMEVPATEGSGPSEKSWQRFRARLARRRATPAESTWDHFRRAMTPVAPQESLWDRFVRHMREHSAQRDVIRRGGSRRFTLPVQGEARIKSGVFRMEERDGAPTVNVEGLEE